MHVTVIPPHQPVTRLSPLVVIFIVTSTSAEGDGPIQPALEQY